MTQRNSMAALAFAVSVAVAGTTAAPAFAADAGPAKPKPLPAFKIQEIEKSLTVGYGVVIANVNADDKPDIVVADAHRVIWYENPGWERRTIVENDKAGIKADNVCLDVYDVDGDGKIDVALGADWQPGNTRDGGSLHWLKQPSTGAADGPWQVFHIASPIPTLHRVHFGDLDGDGAAELIVAPLKGKGSTAKANWEDKGAPLLRYKIPPTPAAPDAKWEPEVMTDQLHVMHNFYPAPDPGWRGVIAASYEGLNAVQQDESSPGKWVVRPVGSGNQDNPKGSRGSSEVKRGKLYGGEWQILATIEPFHGNQVAVYTAPARGGGVLAGEIWPRTVLDESLKAGHGIACADLDGDGDDEVIAGWRDGAKTGINVYKANRIVKQAGDPARPADKGTELAPPVTWTKHELDDAIACEDLFCADLNGDKRIDIVASGRATRNVRIYWNEGPAK